MAVTPIKEPVAFAGSQEGIPAGSSKGVEHNGSLDDSDDDTEVPKNDEEQKSATRFWTEDAKGVADAIFTKAGGLRQSRWSS